MLGVFFLLLLPGGSTEAPAKPYSIYMYIIPYIIPYYSINSSTGDHRRLLNGTRFPSDAGMVQ